MRTETLLTAGLVVLALLAVTVTGAARQGRATGPRWWFATLARLVIAGYLLVAGLVKIPHPAESVRAVRAYQILPESVVPTVGFVLPLLEVAVAVLLVLGLATRLAATLSALLMTAFIIGIASVAARGISIDCGCFGGGGAVAEGATHYTQEIIRDVCLLLLSLLLVRHPQSRLALDPTDDVPGAAAADEEPGHLTLDEDDHPHPGDHPNAQTQENPS